MLHQDWRHPGASDARITKLKDGRTHLAHKYEHAVDMETGALVGVTVQTMEGGDTASLEATLDAATEQLDALDLTAQEVVADKGYHSNKVMVSLEARKVRSYISEPKRGRRNWKKNQAAQKPTNANRRRIRGNHGKFLLRQRGEKVERAIAHLLETGGLRRVHVRDNHEILKRMILQGTAHNLGLLMRICCGAFFGEIWSISHIFSGSVPPGAHLAILDPKTDKKERAYAGMRDLEDTILK